jgi:hypothetical protein
MASASDRRGMCLNNSASRRPTDKRTPLSSLFCPHSYAKVIRAAIKRAWMYTERTITKCDSTNEHTCRSATLGFPRVSSVLAPLRPKENDISKRISRWSLPRPSYSRGVGVTTGDGDAEPPLASPCAGLERRGTCISERR